MTPSRIARDRERRSGNARQPQFGGARFERGEQMPVLDVVAEGIEPDLGGVEKDFGRAEQPLRVVDDAKFLQRRGVRQARLPDAKRFQRGDRAGKQRSGAMVRLGRRRDQERVHAGRGKRDGADETGRAAADDGHFGGETRPVRCSSLLLHPYAVACR